MSRLGYSNEDFLNLIIIYGECNKIMDRTCRVFAERFPNLHRPNKNILRRLLRNCRDFGSFSSVINKKKPLVNNEDIEIVVLAYFTAYPENSLKDAETSLRISCSSINRILIKHKWRPFKYHQVQNLKPHDLPARVEFCEWFLIKIQEDPEFMKNMIWTDEAKFSKNGMYNRHNSHFWAAENPKLVRQRNFQDSWSFNVFCAIKEDRILCLYLYDENLNSDRYSHIIRNVVGESIRHVSEQYRSKLWYQMDGAPAHSTATVAGLLNGMFEDQWLCYNGPFKFPPRSPDLTPLDFFIWGYIKENVYADPVSDKENMKRRVLNAFNNLIPDSIQKATNSGMQKRIYSCLEQNGNVFEHLLK